MSGKQLDLTLGYINSSVAASGETEAHRKETACPGPLASGGPIQAEKEPRCPGPLALSSNSGPSHIRDVRNVPGRGGSWDGVATEGAGLCWTQRARRSLQEAGMQGEVGAGEDGGCGQLNIKGRPWWPRHLPRG